MKYLQLFIAFLTLTYFKINWAKIEFTNIKCNSLDKSFSEFEYCFIKSVNRSYKYISIKCNLYKGPIDNGIINIAIMKRLNGWKPFLYNVTFDGCNFLRNQKRNPVVQFLTNLAIPYTNFNHTCPYDHFIILEKLPMSYLSETFSTVLPVPAGEYAFMTRWYTQGILRATVNAYAQIDEPKHL